MSLIPCDYCHQRVPEKLAQVTTAWYNAAGDRVAYRQRLCTACVCANILPLNIEIDFNNLKCPGCGMSTEHDMDPCYVTAFFPGRGKEQFEFPTCPKCAVDLRARSQQGGTKMENRERVDGPVASPSTRTTRETYWAGLGIAPQARDS